MANAPAKAPWHHRVLVKVPPQYHEEMVAVHNRNSVVFLWFASVVYGLFLGLDVVVYPSHWKTLLLIRVPVVLWSALGLAVAHQGGRGTQHFALAAAFLATTSVGLMCAVTDGFASNYYIGMILCFVAIAVVQIAPPMQTLAVLLGSTVAYFAFNIWMDPNPTVPSVASAAFFLLGAVLFCETGSLLFENQRRSLYLVQAQLQENHEALARAHGLQREFLGRITHELRTPVNSILGFVELIREAEENLTAGGARRLDRIDTSARRLLLLISDILDLAKLEAGALTADPSDVAVDPLLHEVAEATRSLVGRRAVDIQVNNQGPETLQTDEARLRQILMNLCSNAAKYTMEGSIILSVASDNAENVVFSVADTGLGIAPEALPQLFGAFKQARKADQRIGTGLGLNIVQQFAELLGGSVDLDSTVGRGTVFKVALPLRWRPNG